MSLVMEGGNGKSFVMNLMDTPGEGSCWSWRYGNGNLASWLGIAPGGQPQRQGMHKKSGGHAR